ncbi:MAG: hypothetical protein A6F71_04995 [Cycloclasticus sp. symbiont of Poecilosclerida sp. M]|nr:MAG: hypothetical protein A6F71_04995 [Cycloclasticus sp. symbiont of Poecilosclerida sp. M]
MNSKQLQFTPAIAFVVLCLFGGAADFAYASESTACIETMRVSINTGDRENANLRSNRVHHIVLTLYNGDEVRRDIVGPVGLNQEYTNEFDLECTPRSEISQVHLESGGDDGWFIAQVITQAKYQDQNDYVPLTSDVVFNKWLDGDRSNLDQRWYNARHLPLNLLDICFSDFQISGTTGDTTDSGFSSSRHHYIVFRLTDGEEKVEIGGEDTDRNKPFVKEVCTARCIKLCDIKQVSLDAGSCDGWKIADITTSYYDPATSGYIELTKDSVFDKWLDSYDSSLGLSFDSTHLLLSLQSVANCSV